MEEQVIRVDEWRPNYTRKCAICGQTPCVEGWQQTPEIKLVFEGTMCGVCTWGDADCADPANW